MIDCYMRAQKKKSVRLAARPLHTMTTTRRTRHKSASHSSHKHKKKTTRKRRSVPAAFVWMHAKIKSLRAANPKMSMKAAMKKAGSLYRKAHPKKSKSKK